MEEQTIITQIGREVLMMDDYVAVCWNGRYVEKTTEVKGKLYTRKEWQRKSTIWAPGPYIDFVWLCEDSDGNPYEDEDSPVAGGIGVDVARQVADELIKA